MIRYKGGFLVLNSKEACSGCSKGQAFWDSSQCFGCIWGKWCIFSKTVLVCLVTIFITCLPMWLVCFIWMYIAPQSVCNSVGFLSSNNELWHVPTCAIGLVWPKVITGNCRFSHLLIQSVEGYKFIYTRMNIFYRTLKVLQIDLGSACWLITGWCNAGWCTSSSTASCIWYALVFWRCRFGKFN